MESGRGSVGKVCAEMQKNWFVHIDFTCLSKMVLNVCTPFHIYRCTNASTANNEQKSNTARPELHPVPVRSPWYHLGIAFISPYSPPSATGNKYVLAV